MRRPGSGDGAFCLRRRSAGMTPKLVITDLSKRLPRAGSGGNGGEGLEVLRGVSLQVGQGEFVALLGPSGCGKSTLCNIVAGLFPPDHGEVRLDGAPLAASRGRVAYMQQKDLLLPWRRVIDNAILGLEVQGAPRAAARKEARVLLSARVYVMTARPGRVRAEIPIPLPRPRQATDGGVVREKARLLALLHDEMAEAFR